MNSLIIGKMRLLLFMIVLLFHASCTDLGSTDRYNYTVRNESGVPLKIIGYVTYTNVEEYIIDLGIDKEITQSYEDGLPPRGYNFSSLFGSSDGSSAADSIRIIYDKIKFKSFGINNLSDERNPLGPNHNDGSLKATYTITQSDYEIAEDCNGNCD